MKTFLPRLLAILKISGWSRFALLIAAIIAQGVSQTIGIGLIFPFLNLVGLRQDSSSLSIPLDKLPGWAHYLIDLVPVVTADNLILCAGLATIVCMVAANTVGFLSDLYKGRYAQFCAFRISIKTLEIISRKPYIYYVNTNTNELVKKILQDILIFTQGILMPFVEATSRIVLSMLLVFMTLIIDPVVTGISALLFGVPYIVIFLSLRKRIKDMDKKRNEYTKLQIRSGYEFFHGIKAILASQRKDYFIQRFADNSFQLALLNARMPAINAAPRYTLEALAFTSLVGAILIINQQGSTIQSILPTLSLFALAGYRLLPSLQLIYGTFTNIWFKRKAMDEIYEEVFVRDKTFSSDYESVDWKQLQAIQPIRFSSEIKLKDITYTYPGLSEPILNNLSLTIPKGHKVGFVGKTGSGKSTLIDIILGLHKPDSGTIQADNVTIGSDNMVAWRKCIGYVPQEIFLIDEPLYKNIAFGIPDELIDMEKVHKAAKRAQLEEFIETELPEKFNTRVGEQGVRLSGGQRQRIGLARALYLEPDILILDEATSALDNKTENLVMQAINNLNKEITILMIAHRLSTLQKCNTIFFLDHGKITGQGTFDELKTNHASFFDPSH